MRSQTQTKIITSFTSYWEMLHAVVWPTTTQTESVLFPNVLCWWMAFSCEHSQNPGFDLEPKSCKLSSCDQTVSSLQAVQICFFLLSMTFIYLLSMTSFLILLGNSGQDVIALVLLVTAAVRVLAREDTIFRCLCDIPDVVCFFKLWLFHTNRYLQKRTVTKDSLS